MSLLQIFKKFPTVESCEAHFKIQREKDGVVCKGCKSKEHYWLQYKKQWQCKSCGFRTTLRSGTIMHNSKMNMYLWYMTMAYMTDLRKGVSARELQKQLGAKHYKSIWLLAHKIRSSMGLRDAKYILKGEVEFDEGFFVVSSSAAQKAQSKTGRGSKHVQNVAVMAESTPIEDVNAATQSRQCRYYKMQVVKGQKADGINEIVEKNIDQSSIVFSDKSTSYVDIAKYVEAHHVEKSSKKTTIETLRWVHIAISNAKRVFLGVYHHMKGKYLQNYLNEFTYKINRRYFKDRIFERITLATACQY